MPHCGLARCYEEGYGEPFKKHIFGGGIVLVRGDMCSTKEMQDESASGGGVTFNPILQIYV